LEAAHPNITVCMFFPGCSTLQFLVLQGELQDPGGKRWSPFPTPRGHQTGRTVEPYAAIPHDGDEAETSKQFLHSCCESLCEWQATLIVSHACEFMFFLLQHLSEKPIQVEPQSGFLVHMGRT